MPQIAFVFPGQGAQYPGMGKDFFTHCLESAELFRSADEIAGYSLSQLCFEDPDSQLNQTEYAQPALLVSSLAALEAARINGVKPVMVAGLSLGEYTALVASGVLTLQEAIPLVQTRAKLMQNAVPSERGAMAAVLGPDLNQIEELCHQTEGIVGIANYNCPGQVVISGERFAVERVSNSLKDRGFRIVPLAISVPSHSLLMFDAAVQLKHYLSEVNWQELTTPVVSNVDAQENSKERLIDTLTRQLYSPVRWEESIRYMMQKVDYFIEIGPGSILSGLIKKIDRSRVLGNIEDMRSLQKTLEKVKAL